MNWTSEMAIWYSGSRIAAFGCPRYLSLEIETILSRATQYRAPSLGIMWNSLMCRTPSLNTSERTESHGLTKEQVAPGGDAKGQQPHSPPLPNPPPLWPSPHRPLFLMTILHRSALAPTCCPSPRLASNKQTDIGRGYGDGSRLGGRG